MYINAEEWLEEIDQLRRSITNKRRQLKVLECETSVTGITYDIDKIKKSAKRDRFEQQVLDNVEKRERLREKVEDEITEMLLQMEHAVNVINLIESRDQQEVLMLRYIEGRQWSEIMEERGCDDLSGQYKLHKRAIASLQKIFDVSIQCPIVSY